MKSEACPNLFQKVIKYMSTHWIAFKIKVNIHVLSKSTGVVISVGSCIAKTLQNCIGLQENVLCPVENIIRKMLVTIA